MFALHHARLMAGQRPSGRPEEIFDAHVLACVLANAATEVEAGEGDLASNTGLDAAMLEMVLDHWFPFADDLGLARGRAGAPLEEEEMLLDLLLAHAATGEGRGRDEPDLPAILARVVARRAMRPDHLWQDLGLFDRSELSRLLLRHFPTLAAGNTANMKWKKYFYRKLCEGEGFTLCTAPSCAECTDFSACFGAEDGESRMARARREVDRVEHREAAE
ncbi:MAG: nitrogen fixation protein NifQ [Siculibacillus sp.]|nr:nitrogen fixation protein NifQ [Siculibacillus sp.]